MTTGSAAPQGEVSIEKVDVVFGQGNEAHAAVTDITIHIAAGEFVCLLGPSGCGKSTLLNSIAGFVKPTRGHVLIDGQPVDGPGPGQGMVFQQYSLFPWKTVIDNVAFGPRMHGRSRAEARSLAGEYLDLVGLSNVAKRYPATLSGGMQQRVGIARALVNQPRLLVMDEPFGALDAQTRAIMQENLLHIWSRIGTTVVFVTHDIDEAVFMADRVLVMSAGPGRIIADIAIELSRPRHRDITTEDAFIHIKRQCLDIINVESRKAFERQNY
ncbi:MAG: ABC transporter ATP-binding protein [Candidatus Accumulibacter sp.]|nr:ABC transporter ATP-binding protein [Accumulibacter sp.]